MLFYAESEPMLKGWIARFFAPSGIWVVHNPKHRAVWCSKTDCPHLNRKITYDIVKDDDVEDIILTGVSEEMAHGEDVTRRTRRVSTPTIKHHDLGVLAAFPTEKEAVEFLKTYFQTHQDKIDTDSEYELLISKIDMT